MSKELLDFMVWVNQDKKLGYTPIGIERIVNTYTNPKEKQKTMTNTLDKQYTDLLQTILDYGVEKKDRTGTGTKSIFGYTIRHNMKHGFPLLTTKKMAWKTMVTELLWFLRGDTNIKYLVDNNCHIWDGDAYKSYLEYTRNLHVDILKYTIILSQEDFINRIKTDTEFAKKWGELGPVYGAQWRKWYWRSEPVLPEEKYMIYTTEGKPVTWSEDKYIDQIDNLIDDLKTNPDSRRLMVNAWNVGELGQMVLPPCHYSFQVYTRELSNEEKWEQYTKSGLNIEINGTPLELKHMGTAFYPESLPQRAISLMWNQRSVDTFLGLPFNIASYGLLLTMIADEMNMVPDELIGNLGDTHIYLNHIEQVKEQIGRDLTDEERYNIWFDNNYETGMERFFDPNKLPNFDDPYYKPTPYRTREPYPLPKVSVRDGIYCSSVNDVILENYQSHPAIKAPLSN
jgi:thymidylate synthase